jgi:hypothetical protein
MESHEHEFSEWTILAQVRFKTGSANLEEPMNIVDADVFRFSPYAQPVTLQVRDTRVARVIIEMRYVYKAKILGFDVVPSCYSANALFDLETESANSIKMMVAGKAFYPSYNVMTLHNLDAFGRGNLGMSLLLIPENTLILGEYFPQMTVELIKELEKNDLHAVDLFYAMFYYLHPPHEPIQQKYVRPLLIFAHVHCMPYLLNSMENVSLLSSHLMIRHL